MLGFPVPEAALSILARWLAFALASALPCAAQTGITWGPEQAPLGCPIYYSFVNDGPTPLSYYPCAFAVYDAGGAPVYAPPCGGSVVLLPGEFFAHRWPQVDSAGQPVAPGLYHLNDAFGPAVQVGGADAAVAPIGSKRFELCSPLDAGFPYVMGASFTNSTGITLCGQRIQLDPGPLLRFSLTRPAAFPGFAGVLDASGMASASVVVPSHLGAFQLQLAFVVLDPAAPCGLRRISAPTSTVVF